LILAASCLRHIDVIDLDRFRHNISTIESCCSCYYEGLTHLSLSHHTP
jgi:hypothetical protein